MIRPFNRQSGYYFTLAIIVALFFAVAMLFLSRSKESVDRQSLQSASAPGGLGKIEIALRNFVATQKRLPCPADPAGTNGVEMVAANPVNCANPAGVVPWGSLGLSATDVLDSWTRKVSYRAYDGAFGFTRAKISTGVDGLDASNCNTSISFPASWPIDPVTGTCASYHETYDSPAHTEFLTIGPSNLKGLSVNDRGTLVPGVAYVLISHGSSGYGSYGADSGSTRSTLPVAGSAEYFNTLAPGINPYQKLEASVSSVAPGLVTHFDDVVFYKRASDLLDEAKLAGHDWGLVMVDKSFSAASATTGGPVTLTITLSSLIPTSAKLAIPLIDNFPTNVGGNALAKLVVASPTNASTTCSSGTVTAVAGASSVTLSAGATIPARSGAMPGATPGSCTVTVNITPTQPLAAGAASINYSNTIAQYALQVTPNLTAATPPPVDAATVRNMVASPTRVLTATPPPPIVTPSPAIAGPGGSISPSTPQAVTLNSTVVFTVTPNSGYTASVSGTCGGNLVGNTFTTNPVTGDCGVNASFSLMSANTSFNQSTFGVSTVDTGLSSNAFAAYTLSAFGATARNLAARAAANGGGVGVTGPGGTTVPLPHSETEGMRFVFNTDYKYVGLTLLDFSDDTFSFFFPESY